MGDGAGPSQSHQNRRFEERLDSWKAIAAHLGRTVRTVQRWEREQGLPVHRLLHSALSSVYAYTSELDDWLAGREPVATAVVRSTVSVREAIRGVPGHVSRSAHDHLLRARHYMGKRTAPDVSRAIREYRKALDAEPTWAAAHAGIAEAYVVLTGSEFKAPRDGYPKARAAAELALEVDPDFAPAHAALAFVKAFFDADWSGAESELTAALRADSRSSVAHYYNGLVLMNLGRFVEAHEAMLRALDRAPLSDAMTANMSRPFIVARDWDKALHWCDRAMDLNADFWLVHLFKGYALEGKGDYRQARTCMEEAVRLGGSGGARSSLAHACAKAGDSATAQSIVREMTAPRAPYVPSLRIARICAALGRIDEAFSWLERACIDGSIRSNAYPAFDYAFDPLRSDPRFPAILAALKLPLSSAPPV
jgi:serine/threonine-protein kinase